MLFEARELKPYSEPVSPLELQEGSVYFGVNYVPGEMLIPCMETLVFVGRNLEAEDVGMLYFEYVVSYVEHRCERGDSSGVDVQFLCQSEDDLIHISEYERALDSLLKCSLRRKNADSAVSPMHFEARELKPDPQPLLPQDLRKGTAYFIINYADEDMLIPVMDTLIFIGKNLRSGETESLHFQDVDSYHRQIHSKANDQEHDATFYVESESELKNIFDFEPALEELMRCSLRRRTRGSSDIGRGVRQEILKF